MLLQQLILLVRVCNTFEGVFPNKARLGEWCQNIPPFLLFNPKNLHLTTKNWIWDIEIYPNLFLIVARHTTTNEYREFQISPYKDDRVALRDFIRDDVEDMIGYNTVHFDYPILHLFLKLFNRNLSGKDLVNKLYEKGQLIINTRENVWQNVVRTPLRKQIDLFKIHHFDSPARSTSLKLLEFNLMVENIQDLPYPFDTNLNEEQISEVIKYCYNDVNTTYDFYLKTIEMINLRTALKDRYNIDFTNHSDSKLGEDLMLYLYCKGTGEDKYEVKKRRTKRSKIVLSDILYDYLEFKSPHFNALLKWFSEQTIVETKGFFHDLDPDKLKIIDGYYYKKHKKIKDKDSPDPKAKKEVQENLNIVYKGIKYVYGLGGIHGCIEPGIYTRRNGRVIKTCDVASLYPSAIIQNKLKPEHLSDLFHVIYDKEIVGVRLAEKVKPKTEQDSVIVDGYKKAANTVYGKSNSEYSWLYDPQLTMQTTINNQLMMTMLAERLVDEIPDAQLLMINTDGLEIDFPEEHIAIYDTVCKEWEALTKLILEHDSYEKLVIRDINNYLGVYTNGKIKRKGDFNYKYEEAGEWHKNFSQRVVAKAVEAYFLQGVDVMEFLLNHDTLADFYKRVKLNRGSRLIARRLDEDVIEEEFELQRITRYFVSKNGYKLIKVMPPLKGKTEDREFNIEKSGECTICNDLSQLDKNIMLSTLDYEYYYDEVYKIINKIEENV